MLSTFLLGVAVLIPQGIAIEGKLPTLSVIGNDHAHLPPELPYFLGGIPQHEEVIILFVALGAVLNALRRFIRRQCGRGMLGCLPRRFFVEDLEAGTVFDPPVVDLAVEDEQDEEREEQGKKSLATRLRDMLLATGGSTLGEGGGDTTISCSLQRSADNADLTWGREMGAGTYGRVSLVLHEQGVFALKELHETAGESERFAAESEMHVVLSLGIHENIVKVFAVDDKISTRPILMEAAVGDLLTAIDTSRFCFNEEAKFLHGAAKGLAHVHSCGKMHGDIKPSNILLVPDKDNATTITFNAKISDFGFTVDVGTITRMGTRGYGAPELLFVEQEAQTNMDVFSFGVVIMQTFVHPEVAEHNMFTHSLILTDAEKTALDDIFEANPDDPNAGQILEDLGMKRTLADGSFEATILTPNNLRPDVPQQDMVCDLLKRCLSQEPTIRPTMQQVVEDLAFLCRASV